MLLVFLNLVPYLVALLSLHSIKVHHIPNSCLDAVLGEGFQMFDDAYHLTIPLSNHPSQMTALVAEELTSRMLKG